MENTLDGINGRLNIAEEKMSQLEDIVVEMIHNERVKSK